MMKLRIKKTLEYLGLKALAKTIYKKFNFTSSLSLNNECIRVPTIFGITCSPHEPWMNEILQRLLGYDKAAFMDVGVNVGQTLLLVKSIDPDRTYVGFEPNPSCLFYLQALLQENSFRNSLIVPAGLYTQNSILGLQLFYDHPTDGSASLISGFRPKNPVQSEIQVPVFRFDDLPQVQHNYGVIKVDVEGAELEVLQSLFSLLETQHPIIIIEILPVYDKENQERLSRQVEIQELLFRLDYTLYRVAKHSDGSFSGITAIAEFGIHYDLAACDYILVPEGKQIDIEHVLSRGSYG